MHVFLKRLKNNYRYILPLSTPLPPPPPMSCPSIMNLTEYETSKTGIISSRRCATNNNNSHSLCSWVNQSTLVKNLYSSNGAKWVAHHHFKLFFMAFAIKLFHFYQVTLSPTSVFLSGILENYLYPFIWGKKEGNFCYIWEKILQIGKTKAIGNTSAIRW